MSDVLEDLIELRFKLSRTVEPYMQAINGLDALIDKLSNDQLAAEAAAATPPKDPPPKPSKPPPEPEPELPPAAAEAAPESKAEQPQPEQADAFQDDLSAILKARMDRVLDVYPGDKETIAAKIQAAAAVLIKHEKRSLRAPDVSRLAKRYSLGDWTAGDVGSRLTAARETFVHLGEGYSLTSTAFAARVL
jgi:hypothetical protein